MPQFKVAKTDELSKLQNTENCEDKMYIYRDTSKIARLFYDFNENERVEIGASPKVYQCLRPLSNSLELIFPQDLKECTIVGDELRDVNVDTLMPNSLIISEDALYNIIVIEYSTKAVYAKKVYYRKPLLWNDYYES